jgi:hypothetical protein
MLKSYTVEPLYNVPIYSANLFIKRKIFGPSNTEAFKLYLYITRKIFGPFNCVMRGSTVIDNQNFFDRNKIL